ncbi:TRAP transporter large permease [Roseovarius sp.]|uniref:TRAP transporter large permease n=1 Tax=Roseovarius sp. TaxID=1486281 RepID=UPI0035678F02
MTDDPLQIGLLFCGVLIVLVALGVRVYLAAAGVGLFGLVTMIGYDAGLQLAGTIPHSKTVSYSLSVLPVFILIGFLAFHAGFTRTLFEAARRWVGWMPGGLAVASVFASAGFAAVSGASTATAAVFARIAIPEMLDSGYDRRLAAGVIAASGTLATLIPPSALLVIYAVIVEESVGRLLLAGFIPGILSALLYGALIVLMCLRRPELGQPVKGYTWGERMSALPGTFPVFAVVLIIFSAIYFGWATPTEAGAIGAFVVFVFALANGMRWHGLSRSILETAKLTVMIFALIWGVLLFVRFLGFAGIPSAFADAIAGLDVPRIWILLAILAGYAILGAFVDAIGLLILTLPVVYPAVMALGYDPIWFGIIVVKMAELCLVTPPIGLNCFVVNGARPDIPLQDVFRGVGPFFVADAATIGLLIAFPEFVLWLPSQVMS